MRIDNIKHASACWYVLGAVLALGCSTGPDESGGDAKTDAPEARVESGAQEAGDVIATSRQALGAGVFENVPSEVLDAAHQGWAKWAPAVRQLMILPSKRNEAELVLGTPYEVLGVPEEALEREVSGGLEAIDPENTWLFPVRAQGRVTCWLRVANRGGKWVATGIGGGSHAKQVQRLEEALELESGEHRALVEAGFEDETFLATWRQGETRKRARFFSVRDWTDPPEVEQTAENTPDASGSVNRRRVNRGRLNEVSRGVALERMRRHHRELRAARSAGEEE